MANLCQAVDGAPFLCYCNLNLTAEDDDDNLMFPYKTEALEDLSDLAKEIGVRIVPVAEY